MSVQITIIARGTGWVEFEYGGFRAVAFSDGDVCAPSKVPQEARRIGQSLMPLRRTRAKAGAR
jgi:hypothetical protein